MFIPLTFQISDPAPLILDCKPKHYRRVHCIWFVRLSHCQCLRMKTLIRSWDEGLFSMKR